MKSVFAIIALAILTLPASRRLDAAGADAAETELATILAASDTTVLPPGERKDAARMIENDVGRRLQEANQRSSAEWKAITNREQWERFRTAKLTALRESLGIPVAPAPLVPLSPQITGIVAGGGYRIKNVVYQSRPGIWITANLYRPEGSHPSLPGLIISHAHHTPKEHGELQEMGVIWAHSGCLVLVPDHPGHGERRQHPFVSASDYAGPFQVSRQDYFFRYDAAIQLLLAGESLMGWMVHDLMRGVDLLLSQENVDPKRIIILGAVAGGGDPAAVTAALDERIAAAVPFNFGGPQPETRYPLPDNAETWFDYAGSGSWESTRNLRRSAADGFLPWVIVGSIAPRRLIYGHEFSWDRDRDPVWKRLQTIYGYYEAPDALTFAHGRGGLHGQPPEASHCTHIGQSHRLIIDRAFKTWFGINTAGESGHRHPSGDLRAMIPEAEREFQPIKLAAVLEKLAAERIGSARRHLSELPPDERRKTLRNAWSKSLGDVEPRSKAQATSMGEQKEPGDAIVMERWMLAVEGAITVPVVLLRPGATGSAAKPKVVVAVAQAGKQLLLRERRKEIAGLLAAGVAVCLPDVRGTGESSPGAGRGRRSAATSLSSSELMLGGTMVGAQLRDLRTVLGWLRTRADLDTRQFATWGDAILPPNAPVTEFRIPRDDDDALPKSPEPLGGLLALLAALFEDDIRAVYVHGGLSGFESVLTNHLALIPHDAVVPGALTAGDLCDIVAALAPRRIRLEGMVDGWNRTLSATDLADAYESAAVAYRAADAAPKFSYSPERTSCVRWLAHDKSGRAP